MLIVALVLVLALPAILWHLVYLAGLGLVVLAAYGAIRRRGTLTPPRGRVVRGRAEPAADAGQLAAERDQLARRYAPTSRPESWRAPEPEPPAADPVAELREQLARRADQVSKRVLPDA
jgi:hypothetical protein